MSYVYFARVEPDGPIKIGYTKGTPQQRIAELQCGCPWPISLMGHSEGTRVDEGSLHFRLAKHRIQGEWFSPDPAVLQLIADAIDGRPTQLVLSNEDLRTARHSLGESQTVFAQRFGVDQATVHRWETYGIPARGAARMAVEKFLESLRDNPK